MMKKSALRKSALKNKKRSSLNIVPPVSSARVNYVLMAILAITLLLYLRVFFNELTNRDDDNYILLNPFIRFFDFETIRMNFSLYYMGNYHPLSMLCLAIGYQLGGTHAWPYQLINLLLHLANTALVYHFTTNLIRQIPNGLEQKKIVPAITAILFGIHSMHVESVAWVSENKNVLYTFFFLLALIQYLKYAVSNNYKYYGWALLFFLLSLFSKAMAVTLSISLVAVDLFLNRNILSKKVILEKVPFLVLSVLFGIVAIIAQGSSVNRVDVGGALNLIEKLSVASYGLVQYLLKLLLPVHLSAFYEYPAGASQSLPATFYLYPPVVLAGVFAVLLKIRNYPVYFFGILFFLINIVLVLQLLPVGDAMMADRYTYVPSFGFFLIVAYAVSSLIEKGKKYRKLVYVLFAAYIITLSGMTFQRIGKWKDSMTLWNDILTKANHNKHSGAWYVRASLYNDQGHYQDALKDIEIYMQAHPDDGDAFFQRAYARLNLNDLKGAVEDLDKSETLGSKSPEVFNNRGYIKIRLEDYSGAKNDFSKAIEANKWMIEAYNGRADVNIILENYPAALKDLSSSADLDPSNPEVFNNRGVVKKKLGDYRGAVKDFNKAIALKHDFLEAYQNRVDAWFNLNNYKAAIQDLNTIIVFKQLPMAYYYRGKAYMQMGMKDEACGDYRKALELGYYVVDQFAVDLCGL